ncbi:MAG: hypothetical protein LBD03_01075 [Methanobrevibacter sp.]|jgi:hypothetical protein|nr:hypothetical protein [Candidatus Methanovirga procula]
MLHKCLGISILFLLLFSSIGGTSAYLVKFTVYGIPTDPTDPDGIEHTKGWVWFHNHNDDIYSRIEINPGESKTWIISNFDHRDLKEVEFHIENRSDYCNAHVYNLDQFKKENNYTASVVFMVVFPKNKLNYCRFKVQGGYWTYNNFGVAHQPERKTIRHASWETHKGVTDWFE